jgi:hypothetical protein
VDTKVRQRALDKNVRRVASVQFSAPHVDIRFEKLHRVL